MRTMRLATVFLMALVMGRSGSAMVCNLKVVTDANPDYYDMESMIHSITSKWGTNKEKCWAMFYWNHIARRQTQPMSLHGMALTDPIRQFNDYGFTMCSTISGINQSIWEHMGLKHKYWDISNHTVCEVEYDGRYHCYDNSLSAIYTLCDGETIAGVEDIGKEGACAASGGRSEPGHIAKYHCLTATSKNGFLIGADCARDLAQEYNCFNPKGLKYRYYYYDWDYGHRYILNLKPGQVYTRFYHKLGDGPEYYVPNPNGRPGGKDPESVNPRYRIRGNGTWLWKPDLSGKDWEAVLHNAGNVDGGGGGLRAKMRGKAASAVFKIDAANVITGMVIRGGFVRKGDNDEAKVSISTDNGLHWKEVWKAEEKGRVPAEIRLVNEVNGAYEVLVRAELLGRSSASDAALETIEFETTTMVNSKTQPRLNLGKNVVYVGTGEQTESIVFWPELQGGEYKRMIVEEKNIACLDTHMGYQGVLYPAKGGEEAYIVYRMDAPRDITQLTYGGRFYNRAPRSRIEIMHSLDGKNWTTTYALSRTDPPWDVMNYETVTIPRGCRSVLVKYLMNSPGNSQSACSIYAVRMEANHQPVKTKNAFEPVEVTFTWKEVKEDRSLVERSHTQLVKKVPFKYEINVGGTDHPKMESLRLNLAGAVDDVKYGYSDGKEVRAEKFIGKWVTYGNNLAAGKRYTLSVPSSTNWGAGDPDGKKLTDGVAGPPYSGGTSYRYGAIWTGNQNPVITLDLGAMEECASFGLNIHGYPGWDALKGEIKDTIEVLVSPDGAGYSSLGFLKTDIRWAELPANHMWTDEETLCGLTARLIPEKPVKTRYVQFKVTNKRFLDVTEIEVLDATKYEPFDLKIALPEDSR